MQSRRCRTAAPRPSRLGAWPAPPGLRKPRFAALLPDGSGTSSARTYPLRSLRGVRSGDSHGQGCHVRQLRLVPRRRAQETKDMGVTFSSHILCHTGDGHVQFVTPHREAT